MLTTADKKFISGQYTLIKDEFKAEVDHTLGLYLDQMKHEHKITRELVNARPTRDEVKEIVHEVVHEEMGNHVAVYHTL